MSSPILSTIQSQMNFYGYSIFMVLGNIGNAFIVILFSQQRRNPCAIYLISAAIVNGLYLPFAGFVQIFPFYYGDATILALAFCKIYIYMINVIGQIGKTMLILACADRFMITSERARFRAFSTFKRAKWLIVFFIIFWLLITIHIPIMRTIINGRCVSYGIYSTIYNVFTIIIISSIPATIMSAVGYLTYHNMRQMYLRVQPIIHDRIIANNSIRRQDRDLLIMVISEVFVYVVTTIPYPLILFEMMISGYVISNKSVRYLQIEVFILNLAYLLLYVNSAVSFYIYLISSKPFCRDFKRLIVNVYRKLTRQPTIRAAHRTNQTFNQQTTIV